MKKLFLTLLAFTPMVLLSSCGINYAIVLNHNQNSTQVNLASNNFKVVERVSGSASVDYIFLISGMNKKQLYDHAYGAMLEKANLVNSSKAIINITTEEHLGGVPPFYLVRTVTVSANVIEFTK